MGAYGDLPGSMGASFFILVCWFSTYRLCLAKIYQTFFIITYNGYVNTTYHMRHKTSDLIHIPALELHFLDPPFLSSRSTALPPSTGPWDSKRMHGLVVLRACTSQAEWWIIGVLFWIFASAQCLQVLSAT